MMVLTQMRILTLTQKSMVIMTTGVVSDLEVVTVERYLVCVNKNINNMKFDSRHIIKPSKPNLQWFAHFKAMNQETEKTHHISLVKEVCMRTIEF